MPVLGTLPYFVASSAIISIATLLGHIDGQLIIIESGTMSADDQLRVLQLSRDYLDTFLKDNAQYANASVNIPEREQYGFEFIYREYQDRYNNTKHLYTSVEWIKAKELSVRLKEDIIRLHKAGIVNENSYSYKGGSQILK